MCLVSVVIPTFNRRELLLQTLDSVFAQTCTDMEVIVVDDGCTDGTAQALEPLIATGKLTYLPPLAKNFHPDKNKYGVAFVRNRGLEAAHGEFIAFLDDDDFWPPDKLERQVELMRAHPEAGMVAGTWRRWDGEALPAQVIAEFNTNPDTIRDRNNLPLSIQFNSCPVPITFDTLFLGCPFASAGQTLIRSDLLKRAGGFSEGFFGTEDYELWFKLRALAPIEVTSHLALLYRVHQASLSRNHHTMFANYLRAGRHHLHKMPFSRCRARAYLNLHRGLYRYLGHEIARSFQRNTKIRNLRLCWLDLRILSVFFLPALYDKRLRHRLYHDMLPPHSTVPRRRNYSSSNGQ